MEPIIGTKRVIMSPYLPIRPDLSTTPGDFLSILASLSVSNSSFVAEFAIYFAHHLKRIDLCLRPLLFFKNAIIRLLVL